jgi:RNA polymerase sigma factor (TIGR02999 family)
VQEPAPITLLLRRISAGDQAAYDELFTAIYGELRSLAGWFIRRERPGHTLQPTALVNEAYLRLLPSFSQDWANRAHFFAVAARVMRRILVDHARGRTSAKRSGDPPPTLDDSWAVSDEKLSDVLEIDKTLSQLELRDARQAKIVELRFFGGLTEEEVALVLGISERTVKRDWKVAKAWFRAELSSHSSAAGQAL